MGSSSLGRRRGFHRSGRTAPFVLLATAITLALWFGDAAAAEIALLQGLDKVTARISTIRAAIGQPVRFGSLRIVARTCRKRPPEETPESAAFLEIDDVKPGESPVRIFSGWMFASSPALSALEHPVYDVWVVDCRNSANSAPSSTE